MHRLADYDRWLLRLWFEDVPIWVPNPPAHGEALRIHDLHHLLTGYGTDWVGEAELGAFELASGWGIHPGALPFDLGALGMGLVIAPVRTYRAFVRGCSAKNLFGARFDPAIMARDLDEVRAELELDRAATSSLRTALRFLMWSSAAVSFYATSVASFPLALTSLLFLRPHPQRAPAERAPIEASGHDVGAPVRRVRALRVMMRPK